MDNKRHPAPNIIGGERVILAAWLVLAAIVIVPFLKGI